MLYQVKDNQIINRVLPQTGTLKDGSTVSGYNLLPEEILKSEGWLEVIEIKPEYDPITHHLESKEVIRADSVAILYTAVENDPLQRLIPTPQEITDAEYKIKLAETLAELGVL